MKIDTYYGLIDLFCAVLKLCEQLYLVYTMKQTRSKLRAHVVHVYFEYVCFMLLYVRCCF